MLAVARILRTGARLLLLDEISEGLAPVIVQKLAETIVTLKAKGYTIVLVEQNFRFAAPLADRFYVMEHGRIVRQFAQSELDSNMGMLQEYLGVCRPAPIHPPPFLSTQERLMKFKTLAAALAVGLGTFGACGADQLPVRCKHRLHHRHVQPVCRHRRPGGRRNDQVGGARTSAARCWDARSKC